MIFWAIAAVLTALSVGLLLRALWRPPVAPPSRADFDLAVYRDQLAELDRDLARGVLTEDQAAAARSEIERRMLNADSNSPATPGSATGRGTRWLALVLAVLLPVGALGLYGGLGSPGMPSLPFAERPPPPTPDEGGEVEKMVTQLEERLTQSPQDLEGWLLLGRVYRQMNRFADSADAFARAIALDPLDNEVKASRAEMLVAAAEGQVTAPARELLAEVLQADPGDPRGRYYAGLALAQDGLLQEALDLWTGLLRDSPPEAPWIPVVESQVREAAAELGLDGEALLGGLDRPRGPSAADLEAAGEMSPAERQAMIQNMVAGLAERLAAEPGDLDGWLRLIRAYLVLGETEKARSALAKAEEQAVALPAEDPRHQALAAARESLPAAE